MLTFLRLPITESSLSDHWCWQLGHFCFTCLYLCVIDCRIEANGVTPIPVPTSTACSALYMLLEGDPKGPSTKMSSDLSLPEEKGERGVGRG